MKKMQIRNLLFAATWVVTFGRVLFAQQQPPVPVVGAHVIEREVAAGQVFVGDVYPSKKVVVGSAVAGRVVEFPVNQGDRVQEGQPLAQLLTEAIKLEIVSAEADLDLRKAELSELENGSRPEEIEQAAAKMLGAKARKEYLQARRERAEMLHTQRRVTSAEERDEAVAAAIEAEQAHLEAVAAHQLAVDGPRQERIAQAKARVANQQATVEKLKDQLAKHTIISRFDGYVSAEHTEIGAWVSAGDPVAEVVALDEVEIEAYVAEQHIPFIRVGMSVRAEVAALPDEVFTGEVVHIVPQGDPRTRTFPVRVRVQNEITEFGPVLKANMHARLMLPTGQPHQAMLVPKDALVFGGLQPQVFVVSVPSGGTTGTVQPVTVQLGVADGLYIEVTGDLQPAQIVVTQGNERLRPGQQANITEIVDSGSAPFVGLAAKEK